MDRQAWGMVLALVFGMICGAWAKSFEIRLHKRRARETAMQVRRLRMERKADDTQKNVYGRLCNALMPVSMDKTTDQRGVEVIPLGTRNSGDCLINIFWRNEHHSLGILGITIGKDFIGVASMSNPCPQGKARNYRTSLAEGDVANAIDDIKTFLLETYRFAYQTARMGAR